jgi:hypothetical protein
MKLGEHVCPYTPPRVYPLTIMEEGVGGRKGDRNQVSSTIFCDCIFLIWAIIPGWEPEILINTINSSVCFPFEVFSTVFAHKSLCNVYGLVLCFR